MREFATHECENLKDRGEVIELSFCNQYWQLVDRHGRQIRKGVLFCPDCGMRLGDTPAESATTGKKLNVQTGEAWANL